MIMKRAIEHRVYKTSEQMKADFKKFEEKVNALKRESGYDIKTDTFTIEPVKIFYEISIERKA